MGDLRVAKGKGKGKKDKSKQTQLTTLSWHLSQVGNHVPSNSGLLSDRRASSGILSSMQFDDLEVSITRELPQLGNRSLSRLFHSMCFEDVNANTVFHNIPRLGSPRVKIAGTSKRI